MNTPNIATATQVANNENAEKFLPTAGRDEQSKDKKSKRVYGLFDEPDPSISRVVKYTLYHLNGEVSNMIFQMPNYSAWFCHHEEAAGIINEYVYFLAANVIQIAKFKAELGVIRDGKFKPTPVPSYRTKMIEIPVNKVFIPGTEGKWVSLEEAKAIEGGVSC